VYNFIIFFCICISAKSKLHDYFQSVCFYSLSTETGLLCSWSLFTSLRPRVCNNLMFSLSLTNLQLLTLLIILFFWTSCVCIWHYIYCFVFDKILPVELFLQCQHSNYQSVFQLLFTVFQGSVPGPLTFISYTTPLSTVISNSSTNHHYMQTILNFS
jgi:hypothetical protein